MWSLRVSKCSIRRTVSKPFSSNLQRMFHQSACHAVIASKERRAGRTKHLWPASSQEAFTEKSALNWRGDGRHKYRLKQTRCKKIRVCVWVMISWWECVRPSGSALPQLFFFVPCCCSFKWNVDFSSTRVFYTTAVCNGAQPAVLRHTWGFIPVHHHHHGWKEGSPTNVIVVCSGENLHFLFTFSQLLCFICLFPVMYSRVVLFAACATDQCWQSPDLVLQRPSRVQKALLLTWAFHSPRGRCGSFAVPEVNRKLKHKCSNWYLSFFYLNVLEQNLTTDFQFPSCFQWEEQ